MKTAVTLKRGPLMPKKRLLNDGLISDFDSVGHNLARGLAGFSIALGVAELVAAGPLANWLGMHDRRHLLRLHGIREIGHGVGILSTNRPADRSAWVWSRVVGDVLDVVTLAPGLDECNLKRKRVGYAIAAVAGVAALDVMCAVCLKRNAPSRSTTPSSQAAREPGPDTRYAHAMRQGEVV